LHDLPERFGVLPICFFPVHGDTPPLQ